ncbi:PEP-CTERM sorting domain-containing protein [Fimbriimonadia bacterium ATM]|nr:MAG: PEP-CTERM sorting domain-containing protein [Armatimonadota bacterium]MBC6970821.1 PEP-CTERM sorting domain-containing protein [Armatimonadota bacterium]MCE7900997.1 PEP-CTERM sorting domain-containing protein [Armatimonadetes bacterium ATM1]MDL1929887.1 PEP-CTERM sorting domain-containing protein [Fimbriimonadia bacterium ATM]RIJ94576.1 MAG: hypothetical protein DCC45_12235 [Armatimonadota bacterium]
MFLRCALGLTLLGPTLACSQSLHHYVRVLHGSGWIGEFQYGYYDLGTYYGYAYLSGSILDYQGTVLGRVETEVVPERPTPGHFVLDVTSTASTFQTPQPMISYVLTQTSAVLTLVQPMVVDLEATYQGTSAGERRMDGGELSLRRGSQFEFRFENSSGSFHGVLEPGDYDLEIWARVRGNLPQQSLAHATYHVDLTFTPVPEPSTLAVGVGLAGLALRRYRRRS